MSATARAMRPLPSSKGWMVTNHRCASPASSTGSDSRRRLEPVQERSHLRIESGGRRRLEVHALAAGRPGNHLHGIGAAAAPRPDRDPPHAAATGGEQRRVPVVQPAPCRQGFGRSVPRRVQHHLDDAFDITIRPPDTAGVHAETPRDRGSDLCRVELLALDIAALDHVLDQCSEHRLASKIEPEGLHATEEATLPMPDVRQRVDYCLTVPVQARPVRLFVDVHSPHDLRRL